MLSRCANPECKAPFRYLKEGQMFVAEWANPGDTCDLTDTMGSSERWARREMFWLCNTCSRTLTLTVKGSDVIAVPRAKVPRGERLLRELRISG
ncbi:MAG TPA: hypothetical protein VMU28_06760 [Terriglobales bacterium]|nr:hypothetical protein [Terriglobales bacterium]